jgi:hypothetical protein
MRRDSFIYGLVLLLIFTGFISFKQTIKRMKESENEVCIKYFQIQKKYFEQKLLLQKFLDTMETNCDELNVLFPESTPGLAGPKVPADPDFEQFRAERKIQEELDRLINSTEKIVLSSCHDLPASTRAIIAEIKNIQTNLDSLKDEYNTLAMQHNAYIKRFPRNYYSSFYHFRSKPYYSSEN